MYTAAIAVAVSFSLILSCYHTPSLHFFSFILAFIETIERPTEKKIESARISPVESIAFAIFFCLLALLLINPLVKRQLDCVLVIKLRAKETNEISRFW